MELSAYRNSTFTGEILLLSAIPWPEVHQQIINDLIAAPYLDLPSSHVVANGGRGRATQGAVRAYRLNSSL
jgi:hypothetical protein